jgi:hypothetical protein
MKKLIVGLLLVGLCFAYVPEKTYTFQSGGLIKASELNQNEDDFFNALTDRDADLAVNSVSANLIGLTSSTITVSTVSASKNILSTAFINASANYTAYGNSMSGWGYFYVTTNYGCVAPVYLGNGTVLTSATISANSGITGGLYAISPTTAALIQIMPITPNSTTTVSYTIDNTTYGYMIWVTTNINQTYLSYVRLGYSSSTLGEF